MQNNLKPICIYHGNCFDGFTAAWAVRHAFGDQFDYHAGVYQDAPPDVSGRHVVIVDFSYKRDVLLAMGRVARSMLVLDHHKTAQEDLAGLPPPVLPNNAAAHFDEADGWAGSGVDPALPRVVFDMDRSGAGIAWDFFHPGVERPAFLAHVEDRDLWRFDMPFTREVHAAMSAYPFDFGAWDEIAATPIIELARQGAGIDRKHKRDVAELVAKLSYTMKIGGYIVPVANLPMTMTSDAGNLMCNGLNGEFKPAFAACYWDTPDGRVFSLRSVGDFDVSKVAAQYGGGGHKNAAGFRLPHGVEP